jgi:DNA-binding PadR family transcriptional regulator
MEDPQGWQYGYPLSKVTELAPGTLYPILNRLEDSGLLVTRWEPADRPGRPARHMYQLTADGVAFARTHLVKPAKSTRARRAQIPGIAT